MYYVFGAGISGVAATRYILSPRGLNSDVTVIDANISKQDLAAKVGLDKSIPLLREISSSQVSSEDILVPSPGISPSNPIYQTFINAGCSIVPEVDIPFTGYEGKLIAITGTNGKSTTTAMCTYLLTQIGIKAESAGNIGLSPCEVLLRPDSPEVICLELSSYQLEISKKLKPNVSIFTNFSSDHLERHKTLDNYFLAKWNLIENNLESPLITSESTLEFARKTNKTQPKNTVLIENVRSTKFSLDKTLDGKHNQDNAVMAALAVSEITGKNIDELLKLISEFPGLPHRCEFVETNSSLTFVNDSKSTNVASTETALKSFKDELILILGGTAKPESFSPLSKYPNIQMVVAFGQDREKISSELADKIPVVTTEGLSEAIKISLTNSKENTKTILFSPACASFDQFQNFEKRGEAFKQHLKKLVS
ncbi:UDP-N-acetylmuramoyl-L-alanine--D-glutamate ligase [bacterium]|nr:UDP-N-acetylmuramoyl-L-alanine--D-glutamate ligase [bacterium]